MYLHVSVCRSDIEGAWQVYKKECQILERFPSDSCCVHLMRELGSSRDIVKLDERMFSEAIYHLSVCCSLSTFSLTFLL
jgi:hypothetical protein